MAKLVSMERIILKDSKEVNEKMIQDYIIENPLCLGLGELSTLSSEKTQPAGGRLDLLMGDDSNTRYEVEIQLGATDPPHIIRTIEYWDTERKRYQKFDHIAVIIAEEITGRFMNVIQLFNGNIPIIALQLAAYRTSDGDLALTFTKVLDRIVAGDDDDDKYEKKDRKYWEGVSNKEQMAVMDKIYNSCELLKDYELNYNKFYIGFTKDGIATNPLVFRPRKKYVYISYYRIMDKAEFEARLEDTSLTCDYFAKDGEWRVRINQLKDYTDNKELLDEMAARAIQNKG